MKIGERQIFIDTKIKSVVLIVRILASRQKKVFLGKVTIWAKMKK